VQDTSGAGDSFCASLAVAIANGKSIREASIWANHVAGLSVTRIGTIGSFPTLDEANYERYPPSELPGHSEVAGGPSSKAKAKALKISDERPT
jgi:bifunctional ADP-heptose synthase (sugar kinase/adenylyltransferase)